MFPAQIRSITAIRFHPGEQMAFFAPMLTDKSLQLVQDAGPNTAEGKNMQYSAVWSADGTFIVQVGKDPQLVTEAMEKNEISYFSSAQYQPGDRLLCRRQ